MTDEECWRVVDVARGATNGETRQTADAVARQLATRPAAEIVAFGSWVRRRVGEANAADLFTAVRWIKAANGIPDVSGDGWEYARAWLVGRGRAGFAAALADADRVADLFVTYEDFCEGEAIQLAAYRAYEAATGSRNCPDEMYEPSNVESFPPASPGHGAAAERLAARFPRLAERFGPPQF